MSRLKYEAPPVQPAGVYPATLNEIEEKDADGSRYLRWHFDARTRKGQQHTFSANSSRNFGPKSKPRKWAHVLLGRTLTKEEARDGVDFDDLIGCPCQLGVAIVERDGELYNEIENLFPVEDEEEEDETAEDVA